MIARTLLLFAFLIAGGAATLEDSAFLVQRTGTQHDVQGNATTAGCMKPMMIGAGVGLVVGLLVAILHYSCCHSDSDHYQHDSSNIALHDNIFVGILASFMSIYVLEVVLGGLAGGLIGYYAVCKKSSLAQLSVDTDSAAESADMVSALIHGAMQLNRRGTQDLRSIVQRSTVRAAAEEYRKSLLSMLHSDPMTAQTIKELEAKVNDLAASPLPKRIVDQFGKGSFGGKDLRSNVLALVQTAVGSKGSMPSLMLQLANTDWAVMKMPAAKLKAALDSTLSEIDLTPEGLDPQQMQLYRAGAASALVGIAELGHGTE